jgi:hypothetical protein
MVGCGGLGFRVSCSKKRYVGFTIAKEKETKKCFFTSIGCNRFEKDGLKGWKIFFRME